MTYSKTKPNWPAPVVQHQCDIAQVKAQHQGFKIGDMMLQAIRIWCLRHTGFPHAHMIRYDATSMPRQRRNELPIQIAPGGIPMDEDNGFTLPLVNIVELRPVMDVIVRSEGPGTRPCFV